MNRDTQPAASEVLRHLQKKRADLLWLLGRMTRAESPSNVPEAQQEIREMIAAKRAEKAANEGVIGNYQMMNRVADGTGIPVGKGSRLRNADLITRLGLDRLDHTDG